MRLSENGRMESELEHRIGKAATTVGALKEPDQFRNNEQSKSPR